MNWIIVIIAGASLFLIFTFLKTLLRKMTDRSSWIGKGGLYFPYFEFAVWIAFYFWAIDRLFVSKSYYSVLLISSLMILLILFAWFYLRNILAGVVFKMQYQPQKGRSYTFESYSGTVKEIKSAYLTLESEKGDDMKVPYSHLFGPISESNRQKSQGEGTIKFKVATSEGREIIVRRIREIILNSPWGTYKGEPVIKLVSEDGGYYSFEVVVHLLSPVHLPKIEKVLKEGIGKVV